MEDTWLVVEEDDESYHSAEDSDVIDSETEAELYSTIHYEETLKPHKPESAAELLQSGSASVLLTPTKNIFCTEEQRENIRTESISTLKRSFSDYSDNLEEDEKSPDQKASLISKLKQYLSPTKRHKSDSFQNINSCSGDSKSKGLNESARHNLSSNVRNRRSSHDLNSKQSHQRKEDATISDSSDSDSLIWTEIDSSEKADFKTNLLKDDIICLSSESDEDFPVLTSFTKRKADLRNISMPNIKMGEESKGLWHINNEDLYRQRKYSRRYHESMDVTCSNCSKKGHNFRNCPVPKIIKCFICGGSHLGSRCMNRICSNCFQYGHGSNRCRMKPNNLFCSLCCLRGHIKENCPDLWRRYHLTTESVNIVKGKRIRQDKDLYCWNCGERGHFGSVCQDRFMKRLNTWPCVLSYENPEGLLRKRVESATSRSGHSTLNGNVTVTFSRSGGQKNVCLKQRNEFNSDELANQRLNQKKRKKKKKNSLLAQKVNVQVKNVQRERNFPRTPKQSIPKISTSEVPESVEMSMKQQVKKMRRNQKRRLRRQQRRAAASAQSVQSM